MAAPLVSFISAVYNKADVLPETLRLLREQKKLSAGDVEYVFVDDASTDGSRVFLEAEAAHDPRLKVFARPKNVGPAICFNHAARMATGRYLFALDADDMVPANAASFLIGLAERLNTPLVFGRSKRGDSCPDILENAQVSTASDALAFAAKRKIVRMGFLVKREVWERAGGADESIFIQDQSLPLRLAAEAGSLAYVEELIYHLRPVGNDNLSRNIAQQHHDRFFALWPFVERTDVSPVARQAIIRQLISSLWKMERDTGVRLPLFTLAGRTYALNRVTGLVPPDTFFQKAAESLRSLPNIRRPERGIEPDATAPNSDHWQLRA